MSDPQCVSHAVCAHATNIYYCDMTSTTAMLYLDTEEERDETDRLSLRQLPEADRAEVRHRRVERLLAKVLKNPDDWSILLFNRNRKHFKAMVPTRAASHTNTDMEMLAYLANGTLNEHGAFIPTAPKLFPDGCPPDGPPGDEEKGPALDGKEARDLRLGPGIEVWDGAQWRAAEVIFASM